MVTTSLSGIDVVISSLLEELQYLFSIVAMIQDRGIQTTAGFHLIIK